MEITSKVLRNNKFSKALTTAVENGELKMTVAFRLIREIHLQNDKFSKALTTAVENGELKMTVAFRLIKEIHNQS